MPETITESVESHNLSPKPHNLNNVQDITDNQEEARTKAQSTSSSTATSTRFQRFVISFSGYLETFFYRWGLSVASRPYQAIVACLLFTLICSMGLMNFTYEDRPDKLLISQTSQLAYDTDWLRHNFPSPVRFSAMMITADNVLTPKVFAQIMEIQKRVEKIRVKNLRWDDICFKLPVTKGIEGVNSRKRRDVDDPSSDGNFVEAFEDNFFKDSKEDTLTTSSGKNTSDPYYDSFLSVPEEIYCSFVESLEQACWQIGPLELWNFDEGKILNLTQDEIIRKINHERVSPVFGRPVNYTTELGGKIVKNEKGEVTSAGSILVIWSVAVNKTALKLGQSVRDDGTGELADETSLGWEKEYLSLMDELEKEIEKDSMQLLYVTGRSFGDVYKLTMYNDMKIVVLGYLIMFVYVAVMLGRFNVIEQRPYLSMAGISCAALGGLVSCGLCSACGLPFGNVNKVLPFLLLGIGVDDMFIIIQCWKNLYPNVLTKRHKDPIPHRIGMAVKTAGASITVTSMTDMAAFAIGATTLLPGLKSFCIFAAVGIIAVFFFQVTFFVAWFAIDQARLENRRNAFFPWIKYHENEFIPNKWSQNSFLQIFFEKVLAKVILTKSGKVGVIIITALALGININGNLKLRQEFDPMWFLAQDSHMVRYFEIRKLYYPDYGFNGFLIANQVNWTASFPAFENLIETMKESDSLFSFNPWYNDFKRYANKNFGTDIPSTPLSPERFQRYLGKFLFSRVGAKYRQYFRVKGDVTCGEKAPPIEIAMMPFKFMSFKGRDQHIPGMNEVKGLVRNANLTFNNNSGGRLFPWSPVFVSWETDEIITDELYRNICLSLICVLITIFFLLFNLRVCIFCGICVILTVADLGGIMYYWGMSIDTISVVANVVAIGLCVDYAAHIGLAFLLSSGTKDQRATSALRDIGPAVVNGGFSTFLGIVLLANSETHALQSFFKVLTTVVFFGLFHGLVFLPVLLSLIGPDPYPTTILISKENHSPLHKSASLPEKVNNNAAECLPLSDHLEQVSEKATEG